MFSARCSDLVVPGMAWTCSPCASTQASDRAAAVVPHCAASCFRRVDQHQVLRVVFGAESQHEVADIVLQRAQCSAGWPTVAATGQRAEGRDTSSQLGAGFQHGDSRIQITSRYSFCHGVDQVHRIGLAQGPAEICNRPMPPILQAATALARAATSPPPGPPDRGHFQVVPGRSSSVSESSNDAVDLGEQQLGAALDDTAPVDQRRARRGRREVFVAAVLQVFADELPRCSSTSVKVDVSMWLTPASRTSLSSFTSSSHQRIWSRRELCCMDPSSEGVPFGRRARVESCISS